MASKPVPRSRSPKAGRPPKPVAAPPRVRRRQKTARAEIRKDMIPEAGQGSRVLWTAAGAQPAESRAEAILDQYVAVRAYYLFLARGGAQGRDLDDWLQAEQELIEEARPSW